MQLTEAIWTPHPAPCMYLALKIVLQMPVHKQLQLAGSLLLLTFSCTATRPLRTCASSGSVRIAIQRLLYLSTPESPSTGDVTTHCCRQPFTWNMVQQHVRRPQACLWRDHCLLG